MKKVRSENRKGTKKQAQQTEMARLMANRPTRIKRGKKKNFEKKKSKWAKETQEMK